MNEQAARAERVKLGASFFMRGYATGAAGNLSLRLEDGCLQGLDGGNCLRPFTPYVVMRVGDVPVVPYYPPGDARLGEELARLAPRYNAFLLANHGPVVMGKNLREAADNTEELEDTAKLIFTLGDRPIHYLTDAQIAELRS